MEENKFILFGWALVMLGVWVYCVINGSAALFFLGGMLLLWVISWLPYFSILGYVWQRKGPARSRIDQWIWLRGMTLPWGWKPESDPEIQKDVRLMQLLRERRALTPWLWGGVGYLIAGTILLILFM